jgi:hypothetical protein
MKKWIIIIGLMLALLIGGYVVVFKLIVPKTAAAFIPVKWKNIPLGEKRVIVHEYLGKPASRGIGRDRWFHRLSDHKWYGLFLQYDTNMTAKKYRITYTVSWWKDSKTIEVMSDSIP